MSHIKNKVKWCLRKAEKELQKSDKHRGLRKIKPDPELAKAHIKKAEHNLKAVTDFEKTGYSDWSANAAFYSAYHCFLAIITKFGYESRNQECTFALVFDLIDNKQIGMNKDLVEAIILLDVNEKHEDSTIIELREQSQYGINLSIKESKLKQILETAKKILDKTKEIIEE